MSLQSLYNTYVTPKAVQDVKFAVVCFTGMVVSIFLYAMVVKSWLDDPYQPILKIATKFALFLVTAAVIAFVVFFMAYREIYANHFEEVVLEEKKKDE